MSVSDESTVGAVSPDSPFPLNRVIAFAGPYVAIISGALADWLLVHVHFLGIFHTSKSSITTWLTQGLVFGLTAILTWAGHHKWLDGWQKYETAVAPEYTAGPGDQQPPSGEYDPSVEPPLPPASELPPDPPGTAARGDFGG